AITESGHAPTDIIFIGSEESAFECSWEQFQILANKTYDGGFGAQKVAADLIIVFSDGQTMTRGEYDGSEWWQFSKPFHRPAETKPMKYLFGEYWPSLKELHDEPDSLHQKPRCRFATSILRPSSSPLKTARFSVIPGGARRTTDHGSSGHNGPT